MPTFDTGNAQWDQGLSSLGNALFPDPSKAAQGYYYGSEARKAQLQSNTIINQQNAGSRFLMMPYAAAGQGPAPAPPTFYQPQNVPGAAPILAPPSNLPMSTSSGQPLSSAIAGPSGGQPLPPSTMTPAQVTSQLGTMLDNHPNSPTNGGTAPAVSPPVPGAAPASNATTSDGRVPQNDLASSVIQPGSVTDPNGGPKFAPPAAHNGSPSRPAVNLGTYIATGTAAGYDAAQLAANGQAVLAQAVAEGRLTPQQYYDQLAGVGQAGPLNATIGANATIGSAQIAANAHLAAQRMVTGEAAREYDNPWLTVVGPDGQPHRVPYSVGGASPAPGQVAPPSKLGLPMYEPTVAVTKQGQEGAFGTFLKPDGSQIFTTAADAAQQKAVPVATGDAQQSAQLVQEYRAAMQRGDTATAQKILQQLQSIAVAPKEIKPEDVNAQRQVDSAYNQQVYAQPQTGMANFGVKDPVAFDGDAQRLINERISQLQTQNAKRYLGNPSVAHQDAVAQLVQEGALQSQTDVNRARVPPQTKYTSAGFAGDDRIGVFADTPGAAPTPHMMVHLTPKGMAMLPQPGGAAPTSGTSPIPGTTPVPAGPPAPETPPGPPPPAPPAPAVAATPTQLYGGDVPGAGGQTTNPLARLFGSSGTLVPPPPASGPAPLSPQQIYGSSTPGAPGSVPGPPRPGGTPAVYGGAPAGAIRPAPPGSTEGQVFYGSNGLPLGVNHSGWVMRQ